jgi:hypothetical protein
MGEEGGHRLESATEARLAAVIGSLGDHLAEVGMMPFA